VSGSRTVTERQPTRVGRHDGLAYSLWLPDVPVAPARGVVILHGAGSCKESHHDFARALAAAGCAALAYDQRGHGASDGIMDSRACADVARMAALLRDSLRAPAAPIALRGSSMGATLALLAAAQLDAAAVVAICPAPPGQLAQELLAGRLSFQADVQELADWLRAADLHGALAALSAPVLLLHAEGDEVVAVEHSRELAASLRVPASRLVTVPGGHHRSVQHDPDLQALSVRFLDSALRSRADRARPADQACRRAGRD
jgi:alpha-beta hydrolase superfamily lysophospholipase